MKAWSDHMDRIRDCCDQIAQEPGSDHLARLLVEFDKGELAGPVDRHEQPQLALWWPLRDSTPCFRRERATSWTARRRGRPAARDGDTSGTRTRVSAVQGRRHGPLDDGSVDRGGVACTAGGGVGKKGARTERG